MKELHDAASEPSNQTRSDVTAGLTDKTGRTGRTGNSTTTGKGKGQLRTQIFSKLNEFTLQNHIMKDPKALNELIKGELGQSAKFAELDTKFLPDPGSSDEKKESKL